MGNTASVEELGRGRRITHKLSKPRTANHDPNTLFTPIGLSDPRRRFSTTRTTSLPYGTSPAPSPLCPPPDSPVEGPAAVDMSKKDTKPRSRSITRAASALFRSRSTQPSKGTRARQDSIGVPTPSQSARPSRANSMIVGPTESAYVQTQIHGWHTAGSRHSVTYDLNSYEAKRLLNLVEEPLHEKASSIVSESHFQVAQFARRNSILSPTAEVTPTKTELPRATSDMSLYTPMRRRSLLVTPGVATRVVPDVPPFPPKSKARFSLPSTPARRDSLDSMGLGILSIPPPSINPDSIPRVVTPCEEDYSHIGAFKFGSLRITNGSPAISPAVESNPSPLPPLLESSGKVEYFEPRLAENIGSASTAAAPAVAQEARQNPTFLAPLITSPRALRPEVALTGTLSAPQYLPDIHLSPLVIESYSDPNASSLLTTSKHSALEDDLFEDEPADFSQPEVLDVRVDLNAKSLPPRPRLISEGRNTRDIMRSDSGVAATPISEHPHGALAKSDSGYSSNVSLRSFSLKPIVPEKDERRANQTDTAVKTPTKDKFPALLTGRPESEVACAENSISEPGDIAPPVPQKDVPHANPRQPEVSSPGSPTAPGKDGSNPYSPDLSPLSPISSTTSNSQLSTTSSTHKAGKLDRILHNTHKPLPAPLTQPSDKSVSTSISGEKPNKSDNQRSFSFLRRLSLKPEPSRETLRPSTSVGSTELEDDEVPPVPSLPSIVAIATEDEMGGQGQKLGSTTHSTGSPNQTTPTKISARKPIVRKPLPVRKDSKEITMLRMEALGKAKNLPTISSRPTLETSNSELLDSILNGLVHDQDKRPASSSDAPQPAIPHTQTESGLDPQNSSSNSLPTAAITEQVKSTKSAPPVSMKTRKMGSYQQAAPPARSRSTPPRAGRAQQAPVLSRSQSRENIHSYPPSVPSLSKRSSREDVHSYPSAQAYHDRANHQATPLSPGSMERRRSTSIRAYNGGYRTPNWEVQTDHDSSSRMQSLDYSQRSVAGQGGPQNYWYPVSIPHAQPQILRRPPVLRHRSSYDSYSYRQVQEAAEQFFQDNSLQDNGPYPSIRHANGQAYISDPWSGLPMPQAIDEQGRYPPYVPRGHSRNNSMGSHGVTAPYRVLHSYNSPAYRNAPIWG